MKPALETLFATATAGVEPMLLAEARALGFEASAEVGGVTLLGSRGLYRESNLRLRTASRVLLRLGEFDAKDAVQFKSALAKIDLSPYRNGNAPISVSCSGKGPAVSSASKLARDVWRTGAVKDSDDFGGGLQIRFDGVRCSVSIDTSGELLYLRGYRQEVGRAPLRETLAAAVLLGAGYDGNSPLWDPMCGSGTLAIEGAWMARQLPPGLNRSFAFEKWPSHDAAAWDSLRKSALANSTPAAAHPIWATDIHSGALGTARRNAKRAGVLGDLTLLRQDIATLTPPAGMAPGVLVANLPYGIRVGEKDELTNLYRAVVNTVRQEFRGWKYGLLVEEKAAPFLDSLSPQKSFALSNGGIRCALLVG